MYPVIMLEKKDVVEVGDFKVTEKKGRIIRKAIYKDHDLGECGSRVVVRNNDNIMRVLVDCHGLLEAILRGKFETIDQLKADIKGFEIGEDEHGEPVFFGIIDEINGAYKSSCGKDIGWWEK